ncbi:hypothetical protein B296_00051052 [Ensete ventricosum]|uniref:Uncharacterized protein n=1 Tax=Ensete ventricosum TaxID=4639 RepID=A0A426XTT6_ENSVE|nr:hypothetical protein B296_00051052 [Ensete ventricosum]
MTRLEVAATAAVDEVAIEEEVVAVFLLAGDTDNKEGQWPAVLVTNKSAAGQRWSPGGSGGRRWDQQGRRDEGEDNSGADNWQRRQAVSRRRKRTVVATSVWALSVIEEEERGWPVAGAGAMEEGLATVEAITVEGSKGCGVQRGLRQRQSVAGRQQQQRYYVLQRCGRGGSGEGLAMRAVSGGYAWPRKDSDGRWEEVAGASMFGVAVAAGEMGIWWPTTKVGRRGIEWELAGSSLGDSSKGSGSSLGTPQEIDSERLSECESEVIKLGGHV